MGSGAGRKGNHVSDQSCTFLRRQTQGDHGPVDFPRSVGLRKACFCHHGINVGLSAVLQQRGRASEYGGPLGWRGCSAFHGLRGNRDRLLNLLLRCGADLGDLGS